LFAQLVQVGDSVPSQQRSVPDGGCGWGGGGAAMVMEEKSCRARQFELAPRVTVSKPERVAV